MTYTNEQLKRTLANMLPEKVCGVYCFQHKPSGRFYVGSSIDVYRRAWIHLRKSRSGSMNCFRRALRELGEDSFSFNILEICEPQKRLELEAVWIRKLNSTYPNGFNLYADPTCGFDYHFSDAMRAKIGDSNRGKRHSDKSKALMSRQRKGVKLSPAHCLKISAALKGNPKLVGKKRTLTEQHRKNLSLSATGRKLTPETCERLSQIKKEFYAKR